MYSLNVRMFINSEPNRQNIVYTNWHWLPRISDTELYQLLYQQVPLVQWDFCFLSALHTPSKSAMVPSPPVMTLCKGSGGDRRLLNQWNYSIFLSLKMPRLEPGTLHMQSRGFTTELWLFFMFSNFLRQEREMGKQEFQCGAHIFLHFPTLCHLE